MHPSKVAMVTLCYLDGNDASGGDRVERNVKYIKYYRGLKEKLGFERFVLLDNASSWEAKDAFRYGVESNHDIDFISFEDHLPRKGGFDYEYCWRGIDYMQFLFEKYDKLLVIDSDYFVCSERLASYLESINSGWVALWSQAYQFPEAACQVICKDQWEILASRAWRSMNGRVMETTLPFTHIEREFRADRFGEFKYFKGQEPWMDAVGQCPVSTKVVFGE